jgi:hypothetical protein
MAEDLYFWGMYKKKLKEIKEMDEQLVCSKCGSKRVYRVTLLKPAFVDVDIPFKCEDCEFVGKPKIIKSKKEQNKIE